MRVSWRGSAGLVMLLSGVSGLVGLAGLVGLDAELIPEGELGLVVRREAVELEETRLDCVWPIFSKFQRRPQFFYLILSSQCQSSVLS